MKLTKITSRAGLAAVLILLPLSLFAAEKTTLNSGNTAWMIMASALVIFMTVPGLALFYSGMVRSKNVLSVMMQCFAITAVMSVLWVLVGYSIAYGGSKSGFWGGFGAVFLQDLYTIAANGDVTHALTGEGKEGYPLAVYVMFQMTFAIITPALMVGAFAERMKFSSMLVFMAIWSLVVYAPITHWVWDSAGWLFNKGIIDFAGGTVVHINAGIAGLVAAVMLGKRNGYPNTMMSPHNLGLTLMGASILWVGWFGFNAGSAGAANSAAGMAMLVTQIAAATGALGWMFIEWLHHGKPSVLGIASGAVAGLVAITPAAGNVAPMGALMLGLIAGVGCFYASTKLKRMFGYDDSLDVFGVHAVGGIIGAIGVAFFCSPSLGIFGGLGFGEGITSIGQQLSVQLMGVGATIAYTLVATIIILLVVKIVMGLRVSEDQETEGLDISLHDEKGYNL